MTLLLLTLCLQDTVTLRAGKIIPVSGPEIEGGYVVIEKGKIKAVGKGDGGAGAIDLGDGAVIMPGIVDAGTPAWFYTDTNEESSEVTPEVKIARLLDPEAAELKRLRQIGVTTVFAGPGSANVIGGLAAMVKPDGLRAADMLVREDVCLVAAMGDDPQWKNFPPRRTAASFYARRPTTRMGVEFEFRRAMTDPQSAVLKRAMKGELAVRFTARRATDIEVALKLSKEFGLKPIIEGGQEAHIIVDLVKAGGASVVLMPAVHTGELYDAEASEARLTTFTTLTKAGIKVALAGRGTAEGDAPLACAAFLRRYGAERTALLRSLTLTPAEMFGVADRVGSLEPGKDADLLVLSGDPLDLTSDLRAVSINGNVIHGKWSK